MEVLKFKPKSGSRQKPMSFHSVLLSPHTTLKSAWLQAYVATWSCSSWEYTYFFPLAFLILFIFHFNATKHNET